MVRNARGLTMQEVAQALGIGVTTYRRLECGSYRMSTHRTLQLCKIFDCTLQDLIPLSQPNDHNLLSQMNNRLLSLENILHLHQVADL